MFGYLQCSCYALAIVNVPTDQSQVLFFLFIGLEAAQWTNHENEPKYFRLPGIWRSRGTVEPIAKRMASYDESNCWPEMSFPTSVLGRNCIPSSARRLIRLCTIYKQRNAMTCSNIKIIIARGDLNASNVFKNYWIRLSLHDVQNYQGQGLI